MRDAAHGKCWRCGGPVIRATHDGKRVVLDASTPVYARWEERLQPRYLKGDASIPPEVYRFATAYVPHRLVCKRRKG